MPKRGTSSLREPGRHVVIVTTASLPWRTGTAVNPLLRAAYTAKSLKDSKVTLLVPWLAPSDQRLIFPDDLEFEKPDDQKRWVLRWLEQRTGFPPTFELKFYAGRYDGASFFSIFPVGDVTDCIPDEEADVAVLEEPEHLTWFHHGRRWTDKFRHVVGIMHTNYVDYVRRAAPLAAPVMHNVNRRVTSIHCHKVIKLSDAVQSLPRQTSCFCHGVPGAFLEVGKRMAPAGGGAGQASEPGQAGDSEAPAAGGSGGGGDTVSARLTTSPSGTAHLSLQSTGAPANGQKGGQAAAAGADAGGKRERFTRGAYFLGKGVWGKGYTELLDLLSEHQRAGGQPLPVDVYGSGEDMPAIKEAAKEKGLAVSFHAGRDHLDAEIHAYRVFINPSTSDVVATTSAEALAMGKWLICARHPSNAFFEEHFANALVYDTPARFSQHLRHAQEHDPAPLTADEARLLTWEDATERFLDAATISPHEWPTRLAAVRDAVLWPIQNTGTGIEAVRRVIGAGRNTARTPASLEAWDPRQQARGDDGWASGHLALGYGQPRML